ncbi:type II toxin-antitoxin system VapC family toxin [Spirochaeta dissipatitropha]
MLVLDTCALLWFCFDPGSLSEPAAAAISEADTLLVSSISFWEIAIKEKRGQISLPMDIDLYVKMLEQAENVRIVPVDTGQWIRSAHLKWEHRDPADRCITALAQLYRAGLVTADRRMRDWYGAAVW